MKITKVYIENYKSIKKLEFTPSALVNVFIGENSVGKSNIFDAINWLLGPAYPTFNHVKDEDHYLGDPDNEIRIKLDFDDGEYLELAQVWTDGYGNTKSGLNKSGGYIKDEERQLYSSACLGVDRKILDYMPSNKWSLLGRILLEINKVFSQETVQDEEGVTVMKSEMFRREIEGIRDKYLFSVKDEDGNELMQSFITLLQKESARQLNKPESDFMVDLNLYDPWNYYRTLQLIVKEFDTGLEFQASTLGMGIQASISIAILKAYSELKLRNRTPIFIDEPELFLHPQAQRNFYKILREIADNGTQLFITTHSPNFVSLEHFDEIFVVRKTNMEGTFINCANPAAFVEDFIERTDKDTNIEEIFLRYKNAYEQTGDSASANEAFFAKKIILVEGQSEALCLPYLFDLIGFDYIKEGISIVRCGSKDEIDRFYRLYIEMGIPCYIIFDGDSRHAENPKKAEAIKKNKSILKLVGVDADYPDGIAHDLYLGFTDEFGKELGFKTSSKGLELYKELRDEIVDEIQVHDWVENVKDKILALPEHPKSVLIRQGDEEEPEPIDIEPF